mmetsp:Transcript_25268/g.63493  ORF Transcript_25268/g.63493 Transcript_25268/m.63493 type:complete len:248 (-) Transcript_25268:1461-2204(-)
MVVAVPTAAVASHRVLVRGVASLVQECRVGQEVGMKVHHPLVENLVEVVAPENPMLHPEAAMEHCLPEDCLPGERSHLWLCLDHLPNWWIWVSGLHLVGHPSGHLATLTYPEDHRHHGGHGCVCYGFSDGCGCDGRGRCGSRGGHDRHAGRRADHRVDHGHCGSRVDHGRHASRGDRGCPDSRHGRGFVHDPCCAHGCCRDRGYGCGFSADHGHHSHHRRGHSCIWMAACHLPTVAAPSESLDCSFP